ncbi:MAG: 7-cyano-7-deazaguanine synthase [Malacoplasma sp.]|nr:7-cyano-7-deazaguanine synthase [Malacoplasma sp.]
MDPVKAGDSGKTAFAYRNLIFISNMLSLAVLHDCDEVYLGFQNEDHAGYPDTTIEFVNNLQKLIDDIKIWPVKLQAPFMNLTKADEIKLGLELGVDYSKTHTCYSPKIINGKVYSCGHCPACKNRLNNFAKIGVKDPLLYYNIDINKEKN